MIGLQRLVSVALAFGLFCFLAGAGEVRLHAQNRNGTQGNQTTIPSGLSPTPGLSQTSISAAPADDGLRERTQRMELEQAKGRNSERQKKLVEDMEKLLSLANELKTDVDKTDKNVLSLDVIRKADEIEKLAHSVKERMKGQV